MDPNYFLLCASPAPTAEDLAQFPELYLPDQFFNDVADDVTAIIADTQVAIPENEAEVVPQAVPVQGAVQSRNEELRVSEPSWRSNDGSYQEDITFAFNNITNSGQSGSTSNPLIPLIILDDPEPPQRQLLPGDPGPSSSQNYQQAGHLAGFEAVPHDQRLSGLPHQITLNSHVDVVLERFRTIPGGPARVLTFGHRDIQIARIFHEYRVNYRNGNQVFLGDQLNYWLQRAATPGSTTTSIATEFQQTNILSTEFMHRVDLASRAMSSTPYEGFPDLGPEVSRLPRYEGVAHFWIDNQQTTLRGRFRFMRANRRDPVQSWFHIQSMYRLMKSLVLT